MRIIKIHSLLKERALRRMNRDQAANYISKLNYEEKLKLYALLLSLEQKRQPLPVHQAADSQACQ